MNHRKPKDTAREAGKDKPLRAAREPPDKGRRALAGEGSSPPGWKSVETTH